MVSKITAVSEDLQNPSLIEQLVCKIPMTKRIQWIEYTTTLRNYPNLKDFSTWISTMARSIARAMMVFSADESEKKNKHQRVVMQTTKDDESKKKTK